MGHVSQAVAITGKGGKALLGALLMSTAIATVGLIAVKTDAYAQAAAQVSFSVPAGPLNRALTTFGRQAGLQVSYLATIASGRTSLGISGNLSREQALSRLLAGTGLSYSFTNASTVMITDRVAAAHDAPVDAHGALVLDTIDVTGGGEEFSPDTPYETAGSSAYISGETIERFRGTSPADIFKGTAGVISGEARNGNGIDPNIRGMQGYNRTAVTVDGTQATSTLDRGYHGDASRTFIDPDFIGGVSITKGPSNAPNASGAIGGHVAINTITADDVVKEGNTWGLVLRGGFNTNSSSPPPVGTRGGIEDISGNVVTATNQPGMATGTLPTSFGDTLATGRPHWLLPTGGNGSAAIATKQENFELLAAYAYRENGNYHAGTHGGHARIGEQFRSRNEFAATQQLINYYDTVAPGHGIQVGDIIYQDRIWYGNIGEDRTRYRAGEEVLNTASRMSSLLLKGKAYLGEDSELSLSYLRTESEFGVTWPSIDQTNADILQAEPSRVSVDTVAAKYTYNPTDSDLLNLSVNAWWTGQSLLEKRDELSILPLAYDTSTDVGTYGFDLSNRSVLHSAIGDFKLDYGVAYLDTNVSIIFESKMFWGGMLFAHIKSGQDGARSQWDVFSNINWQPNEWIEVDAGLRYVNARTRWSNGYTVENIVDPGYGVTAPEYFSRSDSGVSPSLGLTVKPFDGVQIYGLYKQGMRPPSFTEASDFDTRASLPALDPEIARNYEFGINFLTQDVFASGDTLGLKLNYFYNDVANYIYMNYAPGTTILTAQNYDRAVFSGVELSARYDNGRLFGDLAAIYYDRVKMCPTASLCYDSNSDEGIPLNNWRNHVPPVGTVSLTLGGRFLDETLTLGGRVNYTGERAGIPPAAKDDRKWNFAGRRWHAYTTVDAFASYKFNDTVTLDIAAENIFDTFYTDALAMANQPGPGRTIRLNMTAKF